MIYKACVFALLWLAGFYMRVPILSAAPLGHVISADLSLSQSAMGTLTTLPALMLGLGALPAAFLMARVGTRNMLFIALLIAGIASALRSLSPGFNLLLLYTGIMGLGIAAMQPALPALVPRWCPGAIARGSAVYLNGLMMGEFAGGGLTLPLIMPLVGGEWRHAFLLWSLPAIVVAFALFLPRQSGLDRPNIKTRSLPSPRDRQMWVFGILLGTMSAAFFCINAYALALLEEKHMRDWLDILLLVFNFSQVIASGVMLATPRRILTFPRVLFINAVLIALGLICFMLLPGVWAIAAIIVVSYICGIQMIVLVTLPPMLRSPDAAGTLAAGMFAIAYALAFLLPLGIGALADAFGSTLGALWLLIAFSCGCLPLAWRTRIGTDSMG